MTLQSLVRCSPDDLCHLWWHEEIRVICLRPTDLQDQPDLAMRIRGAFGRALHNLAELPPLRGDPFSRPSAFSLLFGAGEGTPPFVLAAEVRQDHVVVDLRLFGEAMYFSPVCAQALEAALSSGISLTTGNRHRVPFDPVEVLLRRRLPEPATEGGSKWILRFLSPVAIRSGDALALRPSALLGSALSRVRRLAPSLGLEVSADWHALHAACAEARITRDELVPVHFQRFSQRQKGRSIPVDALFGTVTLADVPSALAPFLALAPVNHLGSHCALGLGRTEVIRF
jgi:hypothetical protein